MTRLEIYNADIIRLCETHKVKSLYAFGSLLTGNFNINSDIDFIVDFDSIKLEDYADNYFDLKFSLQDIFKRPIDLLEEKALKNPYFKKSVNKQRQLVYGQWYKNLAVWYSERHCRNRKFFYDNPKEFFKYQHDLKTKRAVERNVEIIGEALSRILKQDETIVIANSRKIVDTRNRIIHGYDTVSDDIIWGIITKHLPVLQIDIEQLLGE